MNLLQELAAQALIGTERAAPRLPPLDGELGDLLNEIKATADTSEIQLLRAAGALQVCALVGLRLPDATQPVIPSPPPTQPFPKERPLLQCLQQIIADGPDALRVEALQVLRARNRQMPPRLLPALLDCGAERAELRPYLGAVIGERGFWLAQQNPQWRYIEDIEHPPDPQLWESGTREQRLVLLQALRLNNPTQARQLLQAGLGELDARERVQLLETFAVGLGPEDEALLEALLRDRSKEVRQLAARLLTGLPKSAFVQRMAARMAAWLTRERKLLRSVLTLEPPEQFDPQWKADAVEEGRAQSEVLGPRAWWLYQLARNLPLTWWQESTGLAPPELLQWAQAGDWSLALLRAWCEGVLRERNASWAGAFINMKPVKELVIDHYDLIGLLSVEEQQQYWLALLGSGREKRMPGEVLAHLVRTGPPVSAALARQVLQVVKQWLSDDKSKWDYALRTALVDFACRIPPETFAEASAGWPVEAGFFAEAHARLLAVIGQRKLLLQME